MALTEGGVSVINTMAVFVPESGKLKKDGIRQQLMQFVSVGLKVGELH